MIDFIKQYHDVILWFCFGVAGLVIPGLMGCDDFLEITFGFCLLVIKASIKRNRLQYG